MQATYSLNPFLVRVGVGTRHVVPKLIPETS